jgi:nucleoside-diphosphate-sugar epimerase
MGWTPNVTLRDGLRETIEWLRGNAHRYRAGEYAI